MNSTLDFSLLWEFSLICERKLLLFWFELTVKLGRYSLCLRCLRKFSPIKLHCKCASNDHVTSMWQTTTNFTSQQINQHLYFYKYHNINKSHYDVACKQYEWKNSRLYSRLMTCVYYRDGKSVYQQQSCILNPLPPEVVQAVTLSRESCFFWNYYKPGQV